MKVPISPRIVGPIRIILVCLWLASTVRSTLIGQSPKLQFVKQIGHGFDIDKWGWMSFVAFNADGTRIASDAAVSRDDVSAKLSIWTFPDGRLVRQLKESPIAVSPDWKYYATMHGVIEMDSGKHIVSLPKDQYAGFAFSPDSRYMAEAATRRNIRSGNIRVIELSSGRRVSEFSKHYVYSLALSPDGTTLAAGYWDTVIFWNRVTGNRVASFHGFGRYVTSLSFNGDGSLLATGDDLGGLQLWNVKTGDRIYSVSLAGGDVSVPAFSPDSKLIAVGVYGTGSVYLIDASTGKVLDSQLVSGIGCGSAAFSPDGQFLITPSTGGLVKWPYDHGGTIRVFRIVSR